MATRLRIKVNYEECPTSDWLEQWDTPEKYYGCAPECSHGRPMGYIGNHTWKSGCWIDDECAETKNYIDNPEAFKAGEASCGAMKQDDRLMPFEEYAETYGDPNKYVYLYAVVESNCGHCGCWSMPDVMGASLSGLDFYEPSPEHWETGTFTEAEVDAMQAGHLRDTLQEMFDEVKSETA